MLFYIFYGIGGFTRDIDIFQRIKLRIEKEIEANPYNLIFNTKSFDIKVIHRNIWPYYEGEIIENGRMENPERLERIASLERFRGGRREEETEEHNFRVPGSLLSLRLESQNKEESEVQNTNDGKIFKSDECAICLTKPPNVLFCNCGHLCLCVECDKTKSLKVCPVCKTENYIKRMLD